MAGTMRPFNVAAVQLESQDDLADNLKHARELVHEAAARGAEIVLLPENFAFMGTEEEKRLIAEDLASPECGPIREMLSATARKEGLFLIGGGMPERSSDPDRPFNTSCVVGPSGDVVAKYRKIHLFDVVVGVGASFRDSAATSSGSSVETAQLELQGGAVNVGLSVCYDLRFPALFQRLADLGAVCATVPAAFTLMTGKDHWHVLLRARAIEAQMFVIAAGQCGAHPRGRRTYGKSCIVDPWGDVIAQASDGPGVVVARLDPAQVEAIRRRLPSLTHRRPLD